MVVTGISTIKNNNTLGLKNGKVNMGIRLENTCVSTCENGLLVNPVFSLQLLKSIDRRIRNDGEPLLQKVELNAAMSRSMTSLLLNGSLFLNGLDTVASIVVKTG